MSSSSGALLYCRVSTQMQAADGHSIENQISSLTELCRTRNLNIKKIYQDNGYSAKDINRPGLQTLLSEIQKGDTLVVFDLSRLSRRTVDALIILEKITEMGSSFVCLHPDIDYSTSAGRFVFHILAGYSQMERETISRNVSSNLKRLSSLGILRNRSPFGYRFIGKKFDLIPDEEQMTIVEKIKTYYASGMNYSQIARRLNEDGDNKCIANNKNDKTKDYRFHTEMIKRILIDYGVIENTTGRIPLEKRIKVPCLEEKK